MRRHPPVPPFRVQIICDETGLAYFRHVILGARHYCFSTGRLLLVDRWLDHELADLPALVRRDGVQGIITQTQDRAAEMRFKSLPVPVVNVTNAMLKPELPLVTQDDVAVGRLAADHLVACGCASFGFWGDRSASYSEQRLAGFRAALAARGLSGALRVNGHAKEDAQAMFVRMVAWLRVLPRPVGIFAVLDTLALYLLRAAREIGWHVPGDVAVLGAGDDDYMVEFENVPLSSIKLPSRQIGYEAAALLDHLVSTGTRAAATRRLPVSDLAARQSTNVLFVPDPAVARAVRYIREHACKNPYVRDVARAAGVSRSGLQARFRATIGRTILDEMQRARITHAQTLLRNTDLKIGAVAERCGFPNSQRFSVLFRQIAGGTPSDFRRQLNGH